MCNLNSVTKTQAAIRELARAMVDIPGNRPVLLVTIPNLIDPDSINPTKAASHLGRNMYAYSPKAVVI